MKNRLLCGTRLLSAEGYTMLPVRAVATALGINNSNVIWNQATKTVTIMYGQRIITMVAGQKVITVNGNTIPRHPLQYRSKTAEHSCL